MGRAVGVGVANINRICSTYTVLKIIDDSMLYHLGRLLSLYYLQLIFPILTITEMY